MFNPNYYSVKIAILHEELHYSINLDNSYSLQFASKQKYISCRVLVYRPWSTSSCDI